MSTTLDTILGTRKRPEAPSLSSGKPITAQAETGDKGLAATGPMTQTSSTAPEGSKPVAYNSKGHAEQSDTYEGMTRRYFSSVPTQEEIDAIKKREDRDAKIAAIGDAISALANAHFTAKGAKNSYVPGSSLYRSSRDEGDKLIKQMQDERDRYYQGLVNARNMDDKIAAARAAAKAKAEDDAADKAQEQERWRAQFELEKGKAKAAADKDAADAANKAEELKIAKGRLANDTRKTTHDIRKSGGGGDTYYAGKGRYVTIPADRNNDETIAWLYSYVRPEVKATAGQPGTAGLDGKPTRKNPTLSEMRAAIGYDAEYNEELQNAILQLGGEAPVEKKGGFVRGNADDRWRVPMYLPEQTGGKVAGFKKGKVAGFKR